MRRHPGLGRRLGYVNEVPKAYMIGVNIVVYAMTH